MKKPNNNIITLQDIQNPTKYTDDVPKIILETLVGSAIVEDVCLALKVSRATYYRWLKTFPEMSEAHEMASMRQKSYYNKLNEKAIHKKVDVDTHMLQFQQTIKFGYGKADRSGGINMENVQINVQGMPTEKLQQQLIEITEKLKVFQLAAGSEEDKKNDESE